MEAYVGDSQVTQLTLAASAHEAVTAQRFEAKYFVTEVQAALIRDYIAVYTNTDPHCPEYPVTSVYLDNPQYTTFESSLAGEKNRYKLRMRAYEGDESAPVFTEVKQRIGRIICKHRANLRRDVVDRLSWAESLSDDYLIDPAKPGQRESLARFSDLVQGIRAEPVVGVRYMREAYESFMDEPVRITFDRNISYAQLPTKLREVWTGRTAWRPLGDSPTVLEIKFTNTYPFWVRTLIQRFQLERVSLAKYVLCVEQARREGIDLGPAPGGLN